jgi:hypothetical protein
LVLFHRKSSFEALRDCVIQNTIFKNVPILHIPPRPTILVTLILTVPLRAVTPSLMVAVAVMTEFPGETPVARVVKPLEGEMSVGGLTVTSVGEPEEK